MSIEEELERLRKKKRLKELELKFQPAPAQEPEIPQIDDQGMPLPVPQKEPQPEQEEVGLSDKLLGAPDALTTIISALPASVIGGAKGAIEGIAEEISSGEIGAQESGERVQQNVMETIQSGIWEPKTKTGAKLLNFFGDVAEDVGLDRLAALGGIGQTYQLGNVIGGATGRAASQTRMQTPKEKRKIIAKEIKSGNRNINNVEMALSESGDLIPNKNMKKAVELLGDTDEARHSVMLFDTMDNKTKSRIGKMLDIIQMTRDKGEKYALRNRPVNILGESLAERAKAVIKIRETASKQLKPVLRKMRDVEVDISPAVDSIFDTLSSVGVKVGRNEVGKIVLNLDDARIKLGDAMPKAEFERVLNILDKRTISASEAHDLKRFLRENVDFNGGVQAGAKTSKPVEDSIKRSASQINDIIVNNTGALGKSYAKANSGYADTAEAVNTLKKLLKEFDIDSEFATSKLGSLGKRIGSNLASRDQIIKLIDDMEDALSKKGVRFKDDIDSLVVAIAKIEKIFGQESIQAPFSFQSRIGEAVEATANPLAYAGRKGVEKILSSVQKEPDFNDKMRAVRAILGDYE